MNEVAASVWLVAALWLYWRAGFQVQGTTLVAAWRWGYGAWVLWVISWLMEISHRFPAGILDQLWYLTALLILAALVSVLGAKRPGTRVWSWFVTMPMLLVLWWPATFPWFRDWPPPHLTLMAPALWAYAVVCVMGLGNYIGTRFLISAGLLAGALFWLVMPYSGWVPDILPSSTGCRIRATFCAGFAVIWPALLAATPRFIHSPWDRVWVDFVNIFGIVWGRRLQDRFNDTARQSRWGVRLDFYGLMWDDVPEPTSIGDKRPAPSWTPEMIATLSWLLRRFVDQEWIDRRVHQGTRFVDSLLKRR